MKFISKNEKNTKNYAKNYAKSLRKGRVLYLIGDLGSGKTQFVKGLADGLGIKETVSSPTFVYENIYNGNEKKLYHFDLYRENQLDSDIKLMLIEAAQDPKGVVAIEWAERITEDLKLKPVVINFKWLSENEREIEINE